MQHQLFYSSEPGRWFNQCRAFEGLLMSAIHPNASIVSLSSKKLIRVDQTLVDIHQHFVQMLQRF